jgi:hypothetical protein
MIINGKTEKYREWDVVKARLRLLRVPSEPQIPSAWQFVDRDDNLYQARSIIGLLTNAYQTPEDVIDEVWSICDTEAVTTNSAQTDMYGELLRVAQKSGWTWLGATRKADVWTHYFKHTSSENPLRNSLEAWESTFKGIGGFAVDKPTTLYHLPADFADIQRAVVSGHLSMDARTGVFRLLLDGEESTFMHDAWEDLKARVEALDRGNALTEADLAYEEYDAVLRILDSMTDVQHDLIAIALSTPRVALVDILLNLLTKQANISEFKALLARIEGE